MSLADREAGESMFNDKTVIEYYCKPDLQRIASRCRLVPALPRREPKVCATCERGCTCEMANDNQIERSNKVQFQASFDTKHTLPGGVVSWIAGGWDW